MSATVAVYDPVFSAYIFKNLLPIVTDSESKHRLDPDGGQLENMAGAWGLSIQASQLLDEMVHPDVYQDGVFAYEQLDGAPGERLAVLLVEFHHALKLGVRRWMLERNLKQKQ